VRSLTRILLRKRGYGVLEAADVESAFDVAARHQAPIDLLITRLATSSTQAFDFVGQMRGYHSDLKVLFVAEVSCDSSIWSALRRRETELIRRPYSLGDMANRVGALMTAAP
jgi:two-component system, cell cycle sensor histidine kinase and response regulator CckA